MTELVLEPGRAEKNYWRDLWRYRELFMMLAWRDVAVRYKQTVAGAAWAVVQPLLNMLIMTFIFGKVAGLPSQGGAPYAIMVFAAMLPWQFFSNALSNSSQSVVNNAGLISKIYFPRMIVPAGSIIVSLVDFLVACSILAGLMVWYRFWPTWRIVALPPLMVLAVAAAMGPGLILTALTVRYRDFRILIPFVVQFGMYVSPVAYSSAVIRHKLGDSLFLIYSLNPMVAVIDGFRWAILCGHPSHLPQTATQLQQAAANQALYWPGLAVSLGFIVILLALGIYYFRKTERVFADII